MKTQNAAHARSTRKAKKNSTKQVVARSRAAAQIARAVKQAMPVSALATAPPDVRPTAVKKGPGLVGKKSGLSKRAFYIQSLKENEKAKRSDADLQKVWDAEFPGTVSYKVAGIRSALNRGSFGDHGFTSKVYGEPSPAPEKKFRAKKAVPTIGIPAQAAPTTAVQVAETKDRGQ